MHQAGGRITITLGGRRFSPRGRATISGSGLAHSTNVNHDGSVSRSTMAKAVRVELTFDRGAGGSGFERPWWDSEFMRPFYRVTISETDAGVRHVFTNASTIGEPILDTETGEISGLSIETDESNYVRTSL